MHPERGAHLAEQPVLPLNRTVKPDASEVVPLVDDFPPGWARVDPRVHFPVRNVPLCLAIGEAAGSTPCYVVLRWVWPRLMPSLTGRSFFLTLAMCMNSVGASVAYGRGSVPTQQQRITGVRQLVLCCALDHTGRKSCPRHAQLKLSTRNPTHLHAWKCNCSRNRSRVLRSGCLRGEVGRMPLGTAAIAAGRLATREDCPSVMGVLVDQSR